MWYPKLAIIQVKDSIVLQVTTIKQGHNVWAWDLMLFMCSIYILGNIRYTWIHKLFWEEFLITKQTLSTKIHVLSNIINKRPKSNHIVMLAFWHPIMQKISNDSATTKKKKKGNDFACIIKLQA